MWTVSGPRSSVPLLGEGIDARVLTAGPFCQRAWPPSPPGVSAPDGGGQGLRGAMPFARSSATAAAVFSSPSWPSAASTSGAFVNCTSR